MKFKVVTLRGDAKVRVGGNYYGPIDFERAPNLTQSWDDELRALRIEAPGAEEGVLVPLESIFTATYQIKAKGGKDTKAA